MFPGANATIYRNQDGEPIGWDSATYETYFCDECGIVHTGPCGYEED